MTIQIDIEDTNLIQRNKKDNSGFYYQQKAYAHIVDRDCVPSRYPKEITIFPPKDDSGNSIPYPLGEYSVSPNSFRVDNYGNLDLGFLVLRPLPSKK